MLTKISKKKNRRVMNLPKLRTYQHRLPLLPIPQNQSICKRFSLQLKMLMKFCPKRIVSIQNHSQPKKKYEKIEFRFFLYSFFLILIKSFFCSYSFTQYNISTLFLYLNHNPSAPNAYIKTNTQKIIPSSNY